VLTGFAFGMLILNTPAAIVSYYAYSFLLPTVFLAGSSLWGLGTLFVRRAQQGKPFVTRDQLRRVLQVFVPTLLFCVAMQWLGLYVASLLLIAGFMRFVGRIAWWKCLVTSIVFVGVMFATFDVAFNVIMPKGPLEALFGK